MPSGDKKNLSRMRKVLIDNRRRWDSNPRNVYHVYTLSKRAPSATRTLLQKADTDQGYSIERIKFKILNIFK